MEKVKPLFSLKSHFEGKEPVVREIYAGILKASRQFGRVVEEPKKTSIHLVNVTAFAGVATRKGSLVLTIKSDRKLNSSRIHKSEQTSAKRFHHEIKLTASGDVNDELKTWLRDAYTLSS